MPIKLFPLIFIVITASLLPRLLCADSVARLVSGVLQEDYRQEVPVSGRVITGISLSGDLLEEKSFFSILTPEPKSPFKVCVQILSRDGRYWAENEFFIDGGPSDVSLLEYPSKFQEQLTEYPATDLAVLTQEGRCDNKGKALISGWHTKKYNTAKSAWIYLNTARTDAFASGYYGNKWGETILCERIETGKRTGYDSICKLSLAAANQDVISIIKIQRRRFDRMLPTVKIEVSLPEKAH